MYKKKFKTTIKNILKLLKILKTTQSNRDEQWIDRYRFAFSNFIQTDLTNVPYIHF